MIVTKGLGGPGTLVTRGYGAIGVVELIEAFTNIYRVPLAVTIIERVAPTSKVGRPGSDTNIRHCDEETVMRTRNGG